MPTICYVSKRFNAEHRAIIDHARDICEAYDRQGFVLTLRQLYYQFVARDLLPNTVQSYKRLGSIVNDARLAGELDWSHLEDRLRNLEANPHWSSPADIMTAAAQSFRLDLWLDQPERVEVWIEKDALTGVIAPTCAELDVAYFACRGYVSQSELWRAARRHLRYERDGQAVTVLHLGDHDPSGIDMTRDMRDRLELFGASTTVHRIALNMDQVEEYDPPPNPAKLTDSRIAGYIDAYGSESWELDALEPTVLAELVAEHVGRHQDGEMFRARQAEQERQREALEVASDRWDDVIDYLEV